MPWVRRLSAAIALLTVVLIVAGGVVTNTDSGLACPDWPMCFGSPMPRMVGGVAVEHTHRLIASTVGVLTTVVAALVLFLERRRSWAAVLAVAVPVLLGGAFVAAHAYGKRGEVAALPLALVALGLLGFAAALAALRGRARLAVLALLLVIVQGLLGGLTVVLRLPPTVLVLHLATSMLFLACALVLALRLREEPAAGARGGTLLWLTAGAAYAQIVLGATVRHTGAGLVCTDLPLCRGALWPTGVHPAVHLHMAHRAFAFVVAALVCAAAVRLWKSGDGRVRALAAALPALVLVQIALGVVTIVSFKELFAVTGHLLVGALLFACLVALLERTRGSVAGRAAAPTPLAAGAGLA